MLCASSHCLLPSSSNVTLVSDAVEAVYISDRFTELNLLLPKQTLHRSNYLYCFEWFTIDLRRSVAVDYNSLCYGEIIHVIIFTLVASHMPQYATNPGTLTVISTIDDWVQEIIQTVVSNGWNWRSTEFHIGHALLLTSAIR